MKIICSVEVSNRALPSLNLSNKKAVKSSLTIGKSKSKEILILHQTNGPSKMYKVKNNIANVFVKFVDEGKATIRFKEPEHDLAIKCDPIQLKGFLKTLKLGIEGSDSIQFSTIPDAVQNKSVKSVKTKLNIMSKEEYPVLEGFPRTLESLLINNANLKSLDSRILRLRNVSVLNLANNELRTLPEQLGSSLPRLTEIHLANNSLGLGMDWRWIVNGNLQKELKLLDLTANQISVLPDKLVKLVNLVSLSFGKNKLQTLPNGIGYLRRLRLLDASYNEIRYLPGSIKFLKLENFDLSYNECFENTLKLSCNNLQFLPTLVDIAAACVITKRLHYTEENLPRTLMDYLKSASFCVCGKPCFSQQPENYTPYYGHNSSQFISSYPILPKILVKYCSIQCYSSQKRNFYRSVK